MKKQVKTLGLAFLLVILTVGLSIASVQAAPELSGEFSNTLQLGAKDPYPLSGSQELKLTLEQFFGEGAVYLSLQGVYNWPKEANANQWSFGLDEAYLDYYGRDFDLRVGKQRINWGTALQVNPTSYLNPINVNNPLGPKLPVYAMNLDYYVDDNWKLTGVYLPFFVPALEAVPGQPQIEVLKPATTLKNGEVALKISAMGLRGADFSVSYFRGKEDLPTPILQPGQPPKAYFRDVQIFGADLATTVGEVGVWAELAYNLPKGGDAYYQGIIGADYGLENGLILVGQYFHHNKDKESTVLVLLGANQIVGLYEWRAGVVYNLNVKSFMLNPEISYSLASSTVLTLGVRYFADDQGPVGMLPLEQNQIYLQMKVDF